MNPTCQKILTIALLFIGESLAIYAEIAGAKYHDLNNSPLWQIFLKMFLLVAVAGGFLIAGYMLEFNAFKNIWIVSATSITSILIAEPIISWTLFHQMPTTGAIVGLALGALGFIFAIFL